MGSNGNGLHPAGSNGVLTSRSVQDLLAEFEQTGRQEPFAEIVRRYAGMVYNVCYQVSRDAHDAEDATQAVFLTLAVRSKTAQKIQYLGPWLQRVAQRLSLDMKRSKKRRSAREMKHHDLNVGRWQDANGPADLGMDELRGILRDEIDKLPAKYRMPLILHYFGGLKPEELSKELGIKANTLGVRLHRARKMLGENLQRRGIVVGGAMLAAALASMIPLYVQNTVVNGTATAAANWAIGHHLVATEISAGVLGMMRTAQRAAILGKIKAITAAVAIGVSAVAGGGELLSRYQPFGLQFRNPLDFRSLFSPLLERLRSPLRLSEAAPSVDQVLASARPHENVRPGAWAIIDPPSDPNFTAPRFDKGAMAALAVGKVEIELERVAIGPAIRPASTDIPATSPPVVIATAPPAAAALPAPAPAMYAIALPPPTPVSGAPAPLDHFASARGSYRHVAGELNVPAITLDAHAALRSMTVAGGHVRTQRLIVGDRGAAELHHLSGKVETPELVLGSQRGSVGTYTLSGDAELLAVRQDVGLAGQGKVEQSGGMNRAHTINVGALLEGDGRYTISDGKVFANNLRVGLGGTGVYHQSGGETYIRSDAASSRESGIDIPGGLAVAVRDRSQGTVRLDAGTIDSDRIFVALDGKGNFSLNGGKTVARTVVLGGSDSAQATLKAVAGQFVFDVDPKARAARDWREHLADKQSLFAGSPAEMHAVIAAGRVGNALIIGNGGDARVQLGDEESTALFGEATPGAFTPIIIGATGSADASFGGHGVVALTGPLVQNGNVIADGFGRLGRTLDFSAVAVVENTIDNPPNGDNGWKAVRLGALKLPSLQVTRDGAYNWGESQRDVKPDLVNSVRFTLSGVSSPGELDVTLLAPEIALFGPGAPVGEIFVGLWKLDRDGLSADTADVLIRYDASAVGDLGVPERQLNLWAYTSDDRWITLSRDLVRIDTEEKLIGGPFDADIRYLAVGVPALQDAALTDWLTRAFQPEVPVSMMFAGAPACSNDLSDFVREAAALNNLRDLSRGVVPEPASSAALAIGAGLLLARRRR